MSVEDLREVLRHIAPDAGFNMVAMFFERLVAVATQLGSDTASSASRLVDRNQVYDDQTLLALRALDPGFADYVDRLSRQLWARPGLSKRERCFTTFAVDVTGGTLGAPFKVHIRLCRGAGITADELRGKGWRTVPEPITKSPRPCIGNRRVRRL